MERSGAFPFRDRAEAFLRLMKLGQNADLLDLIGEGPEQYLDGSALQAVHAGIAFADAALVWLTGERSTAENHDRAAADLRRACGRANLDAGGVSHLEWLVRRKSNFAYNERRAPRKDLEAAPIHAERFAAWIYRTIPEFATEETA